MEWLELLRLFGEEQNRQSQEELARRFTALDAGQDWLLNVTFTHAVFTCLAFLLIAILGYCLWRSHKKINKIEKILENPAKSNVR